MAQSFRELIVWQRSVELAKAAYIATRTFPREEMFGITSQMRRASVSIASNIAEGCGRRSTGEFLQFIGNARGSVFELQTQIEIARELELGDTSLLGELDSLAAEVGKMLNAMFVKVRQKSESTKRPVLANH